MKVRVVEISGLSSFGKVNKAFGVEYKKHFFSFWTHFYKTDYVESDDAFKLKHRREKCESLAKALQERGQITTKTVVNYETDN